LIRLRLKAALVNGKPKATELTPGYHPVAFGLPLNHPDPTAPGIARMASSQRTIATRGHKEHKDREIFFVPYVPFCGQEMFLESREISE
jgi:hypothetical protein